MIRNGFLLLILASTLVLIISCNREEGNGKKYLSADDSILESINNVLAMDGKNSDAYLSRADFYMNHQRVNEALADLNKALELNPDNVKGLILLSNVYVMMGKPQQALQSLNKAISLENSNVKAYLEKAKLCLIMKDYETCAATVEKVMELDPRNADAYYMKGVTLDEAGVKDKAIVAFQQSVLFNPRHYDALMQLGYAYTDKNPAMAVDYFSSALKSDTSSLEALYNLGMLYQEHEKPERALESYARMLKLEPGNKLALYNTGYVNLVYLQKYSAGAEFFTKAIAVDSVYSDAFFNRGYCYELSGDLANARKDYESVLKINTNDQKAIEGLNRLDKLKRK
ncbi:MAG: tetratricopeptide repeat protein [Bacteroidales bacterium]|nr:tetratricopeptide repeat protein [Bacteroidales bacterium]